MNTVLAATEIDGLMKVYAAKRHIMMNYAAQVNETNDLTESQAGHLRELEKEMPKLFWEIMNKAYLLQKAVIEKI